MKKILISILALTLSLGTFCACGDKDDDWDDAFEESSLAMPAEDNTKNYENDARVIYSAVNTAYTRLETAGTAPADGNITLSFDSPDTSDSFIKGITEELDMGKYKGECIIHLKGDKVSYVEYIPAEGEKGIYPKEEAVDDLVSAAREDSDSGEESSEEDKPLTDMERVGIQNTNAYNVRKLAKEFVEENADELLEEKQYWSDDGSKLSEYINAHIESDFVWTLRMEKGYNSSNKDKVCVVQVAYAAESFDSHYVGEDNTGAEAVFEGTIRDITIEPLKGVYDKDKHINKDGKLV